MVKRAFTLIEAIVVIVLIGLLSVGVFNIIKNIYVRNFLIVNTSKLEFKSQQLVDELALMLYYRIPLSVIGYNQENGDYKYIGFIKKGDDYPILEWIGYANDAMVDRNLSGFIDMYASDSGSKTLKCLDFNKTFIENVLQNKFNSSDSLKDLAAVIFAGSFDRGEESALVDYNNSFGWHGGEHKVVFIIDNIEPTSDDANVTLKDKPNRIYEKFYLAEGAYALALKKDLNESKWNCSEINFSDLEDDDLLLFYNYRPWKGETFCGDDNGNSAGNVVIFSKNVEGFYVRKVNYHLEIKVHLTKQKDNIVIDVSKQKVGF
jgi:prepilin-type N-terminal cleavage/methylation domain-containing protein